MKNDPGRRSIEHRSIDHRVLVFLFFLAGTGEKKAKEFVPLVEAYYDKYFAEGGREDMSFADFYRIVCETVE